MITKEQALIYLTELDEFLKGESFITTSDYEKGGALYVQEWQLKKLPVKIVTKEESSARLEMLQKQASDLQTFISLIPKPMSEENEVVAPAEEVAPEAPAEEVVAEEAPAPAEEVTPE